MSANDGLVVLAAAALSGLSCTGCYTYSSGRIVRVLCPVEGSDVCPTWSRTVSAWHGWLGWSPVVCAVLAAAGVLLGTRWPTLRRRLVWPVLAAQASAVGLLIAAVSYPPEYRAHAVAATLRTISGSDSSAGFGYWDWIESGHTWRFWTALAVAVGALGACVARGMSAGPSTTRPSTAGPSTAGPSAAGPSPAGS